MEIKGLYQLKMLGKSLWQQFDLFSQKKKKKKVWEIKKNADTKEPFIPRSSLRQGAFQLVYHTNLSHSSGIRQQDSIIYCQLN